MSFNVESAGPAAPTLVSPNGTIDTQTPTYTWNAVSGVSVSRYQVQVNTSGGNTVYDDGYDPSGCNDATCSVTPATSLPDGSYTWRARAENGGWGDWSSAMSFNVEADGGDGGLPSRPILTSPAGTITTSNPTYRWTGDARAIQYEFLVRRGRNLVLRKWYTATDVCTGVTCWVSGAPNNLVNGTYRWSVRARNLSGTTEWSDKDFTVRDGGGGEVPGKVTTLSPKGTINSVRPIYKWRKVRGATSYRLHIKRGNTVLYDKVLKASQVCRGNICQTRTPPPLQRRNWHSYRVGTYNSNGWGPWSNQRVFYVR